MRFSKSVALLSAMLCLIGITIVTTLFCVRSELIKHKEAKYKVVDPSGIDDLLSINIGGVDQWIHIRGRDKHNPVLLVLHGGPGYPMIGIMDSHQRLWEDYFTVVQWDQRQMGKSYYPMSEIGKTMTLGTMITDTEELIEYLRKRLQKRKIVLVGHDWGTYLGMQIVKRHPEWLYAYVGVSQLVHKIDGERENYKRLLWHAERLNDEVLYKKLQAIESYPDATDINGYFAAAAIVRLEASRIAGESGLHHHRGADGWGQLEFNRKTSPHITLLDVINRTFGDSSAYHYDEYKFFDEYMAINLPEVLGNEFKVPIFFFSGRHNWHVPYVLSEKWFKSIDAPYKEWVWFEESAVVIFNEEPGKYLAALVDKVLPHTVKHQRLNQPY